MKQTFFIDNIWSGIAPSQYFSGPGNYLAGIGIDPDLPQSDAVGDRQTSGILRPSGYATFSGVNVNSNPYWILTSPKTALIYVHLNNGRLISYNSSFGGETLIGTAVSSSGQGAAYYNNYLYFRTNGDISRYGPLDGTPALTDSVWTGATLGSQTALRDPSIASLRGSGFVPNGAMHLHVDNRLYFCDYDNASSTVATRGKGLIHFIQTKFGTSEGDTNNGSTYNSLTLPYGFVPVDIESWGNDLVIAAVQSSNSTLNQGKAALFFWDTTSTSFYNVVWLPDPLVSALLNNNGRLYIWSGSVSTGADVSNGYRLSQYLGGQTIRQTYYSESGSSPLAGAVEAIGDRICWGTFEQVPTTTGGSPNYYGVVMALGSKRNDVPQGVHGIINSKAAANASDGIVTALKKVQQSSFAYPKFAVGWRDPTTFGVDNQSTTYGTSVFRSQLFNTDKKFIIKRIRILLATAVGANHTITPTIFLDNYSSSSTTGLTVINNTNYANSERVIVYTPDIFGNHNFVLELKWTGTALLPITLPIEIEVELIGD